MVKGYDVVYATCDRYEILHKTDIPPPSQANMDENAKWVTLSIRGVEVKAIEVYDKIQV